MSIALCKGKNLDIWYPPLEVKNQNDYYTVAKAVCNQCPVRPECLDYGIHETWGCWGGTSPQDRKNEHRLKHGSIEKRYLGCTCSLCKSSIYKRTTIPLEKVPELGEHFDAKDLVFSVGLLPD
jgi:hypothetical protein